jgi:hypothetical protein
VVLGVLSFRIKLSGHEADNLFPFSVKLKNEWHYTSNPSTGLSGVQLLFLYFFDERQCKLTDIEVGWIDRLMCHIEPVRPKACKGLSTKYKLYSAFKSVKCKLTTHTEYPPFKDR